MRRETQYETILLGVVFLTLFVQTSLRAAPVGSFSGDFPGYTFTASCADPVGASILFGGGPCNSVDIDYFATGNTSLFANAGLNIQTLLTPFLPGPFPFLGTFVLTDLDNPANSIFGSLTGAGNIAGPPGPPVGFPPFTINAVFQTGGGTGAFAQATGVSRLSGPALFTFLSADTTAASGEGDITFTAVPEPASVLFMLAFVPFAIAKRTAAGRFFR